MNQFQPCGLSTGFPFLPGAYNQNVQVVAGILRQDTVDRTKWNIFNLPTLVPINLAGTYATASGTSLTINFSKTFTSVIFFGVFPDEYLAREMGFVMGCSVGASSAVAQASIYLGGAFIPNVLLDGSAGTGPIYNFNLGNIFVYGLFIA